jgi:hypothetical protein
MRTLWLSMGCESGQTEPRYYEAATVTKLGPIGEMIHIAFRCPTLIRFWLTGVMVGQLCREVLPTSLVFNVPSQPGLNRGSTASTTTLLSIISETLSEQIDGLAESPLANALVGLSLCLLVARRPCLPSRAGNAGCSASKRRLHFPRSTSVIRHVA